MRLGDDLAIPFEPLSTDAAAALLEFRYGVPRPALTRLETERDDTFRVDSAAGRFVFKIAHPSDDPLAINLQTAAMSFAAEVDPALPLQRVLPSLDGEVEATLETPAGERVMRVLTWLDGTMLDGAEQRPENLKRLGAAIGRLASALEDFRHPAAGRELTWDVERLPSLAHLVEFAPDLAASVERFAELGDRIAALPHQVVHNDLNHHNVLADAATEHYVTGIIDFGDTVYTARAIDLAVAMSYLVDPDRGWSSVAPIVDGYDEANPLTDEEHALLPELVAGRLVQRVLLGHWVARERGSLSTLRGLDHSRAQLRSVVAQ